MTPLYPDPPIRGLADVRSDPSGDQPCDVSNIVDFRPVYVPTRFGGRTICDLQDDLPEPDWTPWQREQSCRRTIASAATILFALSVLSSVMFYVFARIFQ